MDKHITDMSINEWYIDGLRNTIAYDCRITNTTVDPTNNKLLGVNNNPEGISGECSCTLTKIPWPTVEAIYGRFAISNRVDPTDINAVRVNIQINNSIRLANTDIVYVGEEDGILSYTFTPSSIYTGTLKLHVFEERVPMVEYIATGTLTNNDLSGWPTVHVDGVVQKFPGTITVNNQHVVISNLRVVGSSLNVPALTGTVHRLIKMDIGGAGVNRPFSGTIEQIDPEFLYMDDGAVLSGLFASLTVTGTIPRLLNRKCKPHGVTLNAMLYATKVDPANISASFLEGFGSIKNIAQFFYGAAFTKPWDVNLSWFEPYKEQIEIVSELFASSTRANVINSLPDAIFSGWSNLKDCTRAFYWMKVTKPFSGLVFDGNYNHSINASVLFGSSGIFTDDAVLMTPTTTVSFTNISSMYSASNFKDASKILKDLVRTSKDTVTVCTNLFSNSKVETFGDVELEFNKTTDVSSMFYNCGQLKRLPAWRTNPDGTRVSPVYESADSYAYNCNMLDTLLPVHIPAAKSLYKAFYSIGTNVTGSTNLILGYIPNVTVDARNMYFQTKASSDDPNGTPEDWADLDHRVLERCDMLLMHSKVSNLRNFRLNLRNNTNVVSLTQLFSNCTELTVYPAQPFFAEIVNPVIGSGIFANTGLEGRSLESLVAREHITYTWHLPPKDKLPLLQGNVSDIYSGCRILTKLQDIDFEDPDFFKLLGGFNGLLNVENNDDFKRLMELTQASSSVSLRTSYGLGGYGEYRWAQAAEQKLVTQYAIPQFSSAFAHSPPTDREVMGEFKSVNTPASTTFCRVGLLEKLQEVLDAGTLDNTSGDFNNLIPLLGNVVYSVTKFTKDTCDFLPTTSTVIYVVHDTPLTDPNFLSWVTASEQHFYIRD